MSHTDLTTNNSNNDSYDPSSTSVAVSSKVYSCNPSEDPPPSYFEVVCSNNSSHNPPSNHTHNRSNNYTSEPVSNHGTCSLNTREGENVPAITFETTENIEIPTDGAIREQHISTCTLNTTEDVIAITEHRRGFIAWRFPLVFKRRKPPCTDPLDRYWRCERKKIKILYIATAIIVIAVIIMISVLLIRIHTTSTIVEDPMYKDELPRLNYIQLKEQLKMFGKTHSRTLEPQYDTAYNYIKIFERV